MTFPLDVVAAVSSAQPWTYAVFGAIGFAFGATLEMARLRRLAEAGRPVLLPRATVLKVMFTAIAVAVGALCSAPWGLGLIDFSHVG